jgi:EF hand domain-containing protein
MKLATFTAVAVLLSAGYAFAGGGAPVPEGSQAGESSGRPSAVLDDAACQNVWKMASPAGDTLAGAKAAPYIVNFQMVDTDKDGKISAAEFKTGCGKGWVQSADASTTKEMTPAAKL